MTIYDAMLYPIQSSKRFVLDLNGYWNFKVDTTNTGRSNGWTNGLPDSIFAVAKALKRGEDYGTKTYSNENSYEFVLKYKGALKELSSMKKLEYSYETINSSNSTIKDSTTLL